MTLKEKYAKETGKHFYRMATEVQDGMTFYGVPGEEYMNWLENKIGSLETTVMMLKAQIDSFKPVVYGRTKHKPNL